MWTATGDMVMSWGGGVFPKWQTPLGKFPNKTKHNLSSLIGKVNVYLKHAKYPSCIS